MVAESDAYPTTPSNRLVAFSHPMAMNISTVYQ